MVELRYELYEVACENTLWFTHTGSWDTNEMESLAGVLVSTWVANAAPQCVAGLSLREVYVTDMRAQDGFVLSYTDDLPTTGALGEQGAAGNNAFCISFRTAKRGRSYRGRNYTLGIPADSVIANEVLTPFIFAWMDFYTAMKAAALANGWVWVVASRYANKAPRLVGVTTPVTNHIYTDDNVDTMRGRLK